MVYLTIIAVFIIIIGTINYLFPIDKEKIKKIIKFDASINLKKSAALQSKEKSAITEENSIITKTEKTPVIAIINKTDENTIITKVGENPIIVPIEEKITKQIDQDRIIVKFKDSRYDITNFAKKHPGGKTVLIENNGNDVENLMMEYGHSENAYKLLEKYKLE